MQSVICLAADTCLTADPGVARSVRPGPIFSWRVIIKIIATAIQEGLFSVTSESMCTKFLVKLAPEKVWLGQIKK